MTKLNEVQKELKFVVRDNADINEIFDKESLNASYVSKAFYMFGAMTYGIAKPLMKKGMATREMDQALNIWKFIVIILSDNSFLVDINDEIIEDLKGIVKECNEYLDSMISSKDLDMFGYNFMMFSHTIRNAIGLVRGYGVEEY